MRNTVNLYCLKDHITIDELAAMLGKDKPSVIEMLKQDSVIDADTLTKLCAIFNCEPSDIIM